MTGIYDSGFNTPLPNTDITGQLIALNMRNKALDAKPVISGLSAIGKVFTDAAEDQRKANTAILQRRLDALNPTQVEAMIAQGIDPVVEAYRQGIPVNIDDIELNKAWRTNILDAQKAQGEKWVTTVLPSIPHKDKLELLRGNTEVYKKYGLTDFMRIAPELRTFIYDNIKQAADRENEKLYITQVRQSPDYWVENGGDPSAELMNLPGYMMEGDLPAETGTDEQLIGTTAANKKNAQAALGASGNLPASSPHYTSTETDLQQSTRLGTNITNLRDWYFRERSTDGNLTPEAFFNKPEVQEYILTHRLKEGEADYVKRGFKYAVNNPDNAAQNDNITSNETPVVTPLDLSTPEKREAAIKQRKIFEGAHNVKAVQNIDNQFKEHARDEMNNRVYGNAYKALREGASKHELTTMRDKYKTQLLKGKSKMSKEIYTHYETALDELFNPLITQANDSEKDRSANAVAFSGAARKRLSRNGQYLYRQNAGNDKPPEVPEEYRRLNEKQLTAIKNTFIKNTKLQALWTQADDATRRIIAEHIIDYAKLSGDFPELIKNPSSFENALKKNALSKTGITDESFIALIDDIVSADWFGSAKAAASEKAVREAVAADSTKQN